MSCCEVWDIVCNRLWSQAGHTFCILVPFQAVILDERLRFNSRFSKNPETKKADLPEKKLFYYFSWCDLNSLSLSFVDTKSCRSAVVFEKLYCVRLSCKYIWVLIRTTTIVISRRLVTQNPKNLYLHLPNKTCARSTRIPLIFWSLFWQLWHVAEQMEVVLGLLGVEKAVCPISAKMSPLRITQ